MSNSGRYCITEAIPEVKESCWGFWLCKGVYGFNEGSSNDAFDRMSTCCTLIFNSLLAGVPRQARSPAASASWFERLLLCTRWARWHFASRPKNRWSPFSSFSDACYFLQFVSQVQCMHIYIFSNFFGNWSIHCIVLCMCGKPEDRALWIFRGHAACSRGLAKNWNAQRVPWAWKWGTIDDLALFEGWGNSTWYYELECWSQKANQYYHSQRVHWRNCFSDWNCRPVCRDHGPLPTKLFIQTRYANFLFEGDVERLMPHLERAMEVLPQVGEVGLREGVIRNRCVGCRWRGIWLYTIVHSSYPWATWLAVPFFWCWFFLSDVLFILARRYEDSSEWSNDVASGWQPFGRPCARMGHCTQLLVGLRWAGEPSSNKGIGCVPKAALQKRSFGQAGRLNHESTRRCFDKDWTQASDSCSCMQLPYFPISSKLRSYGIAHSAGLSRYLSERWANPSFGKILSKIRSTGCG